MHKDYQSIYYRATAPGFSSSPLHDALDVDVCIVGAGFAGLATAMSLMEQGHSSVALLESETIGHGASGRNGGFVFGGFSLSNKTLYQNLGHEEANRLYRGTLRAIDTIRRRAEQHQIECEIEDSGVLLANWFDDDRRLNDVQGFMRAHYGVDWQWQTREQTQIKLKTERYHGALWEKNAFHFHPLKYAQGCAKVLQKSGVSVHEHSPVMAIEKAQNGFVVRTPKGKVTCKEIVVTCGGYIANLVPALSRAIMPIATYVMVTEPLSERLSAAVNTRCAVYDTRFAFDYYRPLSDSRLLWGGRISIRDRSPSQVKELLRRDLLKVYPQLEGVKVDYAWSGLMSYATHEMPQLGKTEDGIWYGMGFGGHGVGPTTYAGEVLADAISGKELIPSGFNRYGLAPSFGKLGLVGAQSMYWWLQLKDWWFQ